MRFLLAAACVALLVSVPLAARAQRSILVETQLASTPNGKPAYALVINGTVVARLAKESSIGGSERSPQRAAALAAALITEAFRGGRGEITLHPSADGRTVLLKLDGRELLLATDAEAKAWGVLPEELAATWKQNITGAWPGRAAAPPRQAQPVAENRPSRPAQTGRPSARRPEPVVSQDGSLLEGARPPDTRKPERTQPREQPASRQTGGQRIRQGEVPEVRGPSRATEPPRLVRMDSVPAPAKFTAQLTGAPPSAERLDHAVQQTLKASANLPWDAKIVWTPQDPKAPTPKLERGADLRLPVSYKVNGMGDPIAAELRLQHRTLELPRESLTYFSNAPENVRKPQLLYHADLPEGVAARLVWHHQSHFNGELQFIARVVNTSSRDAAVHVTPGQWQSNINTFLVGYRAAQDFWANLRTGAGYVQLVPAGGQAYILSQSLPKGYTSSGYFKLTNMSEVPLRVETVALEAGKTLSAAPLPDRGEGTICVFPPPQRSQQHTYVARGPETQWVYMRMGEESPPSYVCDSEHYGSYGVTYSYDLELRNERGGPALVYLILRGSAGEVKGQFYIDGEYVTTPLVRGGEEYLLREIPLPMGQSKRVRIEGIALNGGFYPASLIVRESRQP